MHVNDERPDNKAMQLEEEFTDFYIGIISKFWDIKCRQMSYDLTSALRSIKEMKYKNKNQKLFFSYKKPAVRCAYLYGYSVLHSLMIYSEFLKHLKLNKTVMMPFLYTESINICCIGGGPGIEAVAICKCLNDFISKSHEKSGKSVLEVKVTVVDNLPHWMREETAVINAVNDKSNILHSESISLHSDFLKADVLKPFEKSLKDMIKEADIVTVTKVGTYMQNKNCDKYEENLQNMMRNVIDCMDGNSCLFLLDSSGGNVFYNMKKVFREKNGKLLLEKSDHIQYKLNPKTVNRLRDLMKHNKSKYHTILPTVLGRVSSCMWIKNMVSVSKNTEFSSKKVSMSSENSSSPHLQCEGNPAFVERENDSKMDRGVTSQTALSKSRVKK